MAAQATCRCGWGASVPDAYAGRTGKCPKCGGPVTIGGAEVGAADVLPDDAAASPGLGPVPAPPKARTARTPATRKPRAATPARPRKGPAFERHAFEVAGATHENDDGSDRQEILGGLSGGEAVELRREPRNLYDRNAIALDLLDGRQLGYVPAELAERLAPRLDAGQVMHGFLRAVGEYFPGSDNLRAEVLVLVDRDGLGPAAARREAMGLIEPRSPDRRRKGSGSGRGRERGRPVCYACGGAMKKSTRSEGNCLGIIVALIVFVIGAALLMIVPIGTVIGLLMMVAALFMGGRTERIWKCRDCGHYFRRA